MKRVLILGAAIVAGIGTLIFGCERSDKRISPKRAPNPEADPLAQPKSLQRVGVPVEATRAAIPADNPQTAEKISLGQRLFFDRRLSVDGAVSTRRAVMLLRESPERGSADYLERLN